MYVLILSGISREVVLYYPQEASKRRNVSKILFTFCTTPFLQIILAGPMTLLTCLLHSYLSTPRFAHTKL